MAFTSFRARPMQLVGAASLVGGALTVAIAIAAPASAASAAADGGVGAGTCTPAAAWTQTVVVTPEQTIEHPAVPETFRTVHHDAVYGDAEYTRWTYKAKGDPIDSTPVTDPGHWNQDSKGKPAAGDPIGTAFPSGNGGGSWFYWTAETPLTSAAYDEQVGNSDGQAAWTETIPAVTTTVQHDAVTCGVSLPTFGDQRTCNHLEASVEVPYTPGADTFLYGVPGFDQSVAIHTSVTVTSNDVSQFWIGYVPHAGYTADNAGTTHVDFGPAPQCDAVAGDPTTTPSADPTTPAADPTTPAADPTTPAADPTTPAADPTTPAADPTSPTADPTTPAADPTTPAADPTTPAPAVVDPAPSTTPGAVTEVLAEGSAVDPANAPAVLASTGSGDMEPLVLAGLGLIGVGGAVLIGSRRAGRSRG